MIQISFAGAACPEIQAVQDMRILTLTHVYDNPNWVYNFHSHDTTAEIIYIESGRGLYTLGNVSYAACGGNLIIVNPGVIHSLASDAQEALNAWTLSITGFCLPGLAPNQVIPAAAYPMTRLGRWESYVRGSFSLLLEQQAGGAPQAASISRAAAMTLVLLANELMQPEGQAEANGGLSESHNHSAFAMEVIRYMDRHFQEPITLEKLSDVFHISAGHISHALTRTCGISPINYLISRRIGEAQWLLLTTELPVRDIALRVGYENAYHFSKLFFKRIGMRPQDFRERFKTDPQRQADGQDRA